MEGKFAQKNLCYHSVINETGRIMLTNKTPKQIKLTAQDISDLTQRIKDNALSDEDINTLLELIAFNAWLQDRLLHANLSIKNLRKIFGFTSESINTGNKNNKTNKALLRLREVN